MDATVRYGNRDVPRARFLSWEEAREMARSGLIEFASHSYDLHHGVQANPQGNELAAGWARIYRPGSGYESLLGLLQVGEFSSIIGLIRRAQTVYGGLFTVSGVICAFRKRALQDAGWWSPETLTDDVDASWRVQLAGWRLAYEPKAICWILMPETLRGLWRQRLRWSVGGTQAVLDSTRALFSGKRWRLLPIWINYMVSILWAYAIIIGIAFWAIAAIGIPLPAWAPVFSPIPEARGVVRELRFG
jgi:poly-beta-1,6-N-acetyl-D-glucosamine synthase